MVMIRVTVARVATRRRLGRAKASRSAALCRRPDASKVVALTLVPATWSTVKPFHGVTLASRSAALTAAWNPRTAGWNVRCLSTHSYDAFTSRMSQFVTSVF